MSRHCHSLPACVCGGYWSLPRHMLMHSLVSAPCSCWLQCPLHHTGPRFAPAMVLWFTASLALVDLSYFCKMIDWATVSANGVGE